MHLSMRLITILLLFYIVAFGQHNNPVEKVATPFKLFRYVEVISKADSILNRDTTLTGSEIIEINRMKAISHFTIGEELLARNAFHTILELDPKFKLDPVQNSPKIINFFNQIKLDFLQAKLTASDVTTDSSNPEEKMEAENSPKPQKNIKTALVKSMVLPGWGHLQIKRKKRGFMLITGSLLTLPPALYYVYDTYNKEKDYLNANNSIDIEKKYNRYNKSYKLRNGFLAGYAVIWLYSQWDLFSGNNDVRPVEVQPGISTDIQGHSVITTNIYLHF
jgi:hypothetical protein